jgi:diguanylate cyclase (GGDEF)-like protein
MKILVVEDDEFVSETLTTMLAHHNYAVEAAIDGEMALELVDAFDYDLIVLDIVLPKLDGIQVCQAVRSRGHHMPILLLTGRDSSHDKAIGLDAGADDCMVKPFDEEELVARIRALLRRAGATTQPLLEWGNLTLDPSTCEVFYSGTLLNLTPKEYALLELFLRNSRRVFSCGAILEHLWVYEEAPGEEAVRTHIKGLRQKLKAAGAGSDFIETVYGIGYRLKPITKGSEPSSSKPLSNSVEQEAQTKLADVWQRFQGRFREQVDRIEQAVIALSEQHSDGNLHGDLQRQAKRDAHSLAGALGTFGVPEGTKRAREIEQLLDRNGNLNGKDIKLLQKLVTALRTELERSHSDSKRDPKQSLPLPNLDIAHSDLPLLLIIDGDDAFTESLKQDAPQWGFQVEAYRKLSDVKQRLEQDPPDLAFLDLDSADSIQDSLSWITSCTRRVVPLPVVVLIQENSFSDRLEIARRGGRLLLQKPISTAQIFEAATQVLERTSTTQSKVLVVDDDTSILTTLKLLLEPWGLKVTTLADAKRFWDVLEASSPDLLILDVEFPDLSGIELCQVVRNDLRWNNLPVLFLTAHTDSGTVMQVFSSGADDFVSKPIVEPELVARIMNRIERTKLLKHLTEIDPLTGVSNRYKSSQDLDAFLRSAERYQQSIAIAIIDLDQLRQVNEHYGHAIGDSVLRQFGQLLRQTFCGEDVIARWGGEEFVIGMYGMTAEEGKQRLISFSKVLNQRALLTPDSQVLRTTFSAGIAEYPKDGLDLQDLYRSGNLALGEAKRHRKQVFSVKNKDVIYSVDDACKDTVPSLS